MSICLEGVGDLRIDSGSIDPVGQADQLMAHIDDLIQARPKHIIGSGRFALSRPHDLLPSNRFEEALRKSRLCRPIQPKKQKKSARKTMHKGPFLADFNT